MLEIRGRNGLAKYGQHYVNHVGPSLVEIELFSTRVGKTAPIVVRGHRDEVLALIDDIKRRIEGHDDGWGQIDQKEAG